MNYKKRYKNCCKFIVTQSTSETWPQKMNQKPRGTREQLCYLLLTKMIKQTYDVTYKVVHSVGSGINRRIRVTISSKIRCNHMIAMLGQEIDLVPPGIPCFWEAMKQQNQWTCPFLCHVYPYPVGFDSLVLHFTHHV